MDLAKPGLIKEFCMPNAVFTFKEYLLDFGTKATKDKGLELINKILSDVKKKSLKNKMTHALDEIDCGTRDLYF
jgi:2-iminoacetate synthase